MWLTKHFLRYIIYTAFLCLGIIIGIAVNHYYQLPLAEAINIVDLATLVTTIFLAVYIPEVLDRKLEIQRDKKRPDRKTHRRVAGFVPTYQSDRSGRRACLSKRHPDHSEPARCHQQQTQHHHHPSYLFQYARLFSGRHQNHPPFSIATQKPPLAGTDGEPRIHLSGQHPARRRSPL